MKWLNIIVIIFICLIISSSFLPNNNPYNQAVEIVSKKLNLKNASMIEANYTSFLFNKTVSIEIEGYIENEKKVIKSELISLIFLNNYKINKLSIES